MTEFHSVRDLVELQRYVARARRGSRPVRRRPAGETRRPYLR